METISLKATGETIEFLEKSQEKIILLVSSPINAKGFPMHKHPLQSETLEAVEGKLGLVIENQTMVLEPGQSFTVPANTFHQYFSPDKTALKFKSIFHPPLHVEYLLTEIFASANLQNSSEPRVFDACYVLSQAKGEYFVKHIPVIIQKMFFPLIANIGKLLGLIKVKSL